MRPTANVLSASASSMRVFQKRMLSGNPARSRGPGNSSRKKSASWASKDRKPFGTIRSAEVGVVAVAVEADVAADWLDASAIEGGWVGAVAEGEPPPEAPGLAGWLTVC